LLDSGADITFIPQTTTNLLGLTSISGTSYQLMVFDGSTSFSPAVRLDLVLQIGRFI
jgi:hypothetical protein